jgi:hypothetical protein
MRFRFDGDDQAWQPHPFHMDSRPEPQVIDRHQQIEFLRLVHAGLGRMLACAQLKVSERALKRTLAQSPSFRRALEYIEQVRAENLYAILYSAALQGDTQAARFLLARHDREVEHRKTWGDDQL